MTRIKICGLRRECDIEYANKYRPDYIGFVFAKSRRTVTPEKAAQLLSGLDTGIKSVGVFVNESPENAASIAEKAGIDVIQLHGDENEEYIKKLRALTGCEIWKAVKVEAGESIEGFPGADRILLDKYKLGEYGGSGEKFDWKKYGGVKTAQPMLLAGGLSADNVSEGLSIFRPYGVDISSGVETDGFKDEIKIRDFIDKVRKFDEQDR